jgi:hypothetical protein
VNVSAKTLGAMTDSELIGFVEAMAVAGTMPAESQRAKLAEQFERRGITVGDLPHFRTESPDRSELPEPTFCNTEARRTMQHLLGGEQHALVPWKLTSSPHAHLDGETLLYQELSMLMDEYLAYGELCTACKQGLPCLELAEGGVECTPVPMTLGLAVLLLSEANPEAYRAYMMKRPKATLAETAHILDWSVWHLKRELTTAKDFIQELMDRAAI